MVRPIQLLAAIALACGLVIPQEISAARLRSDHNHLPAERSDRSQVAASSSAQSQDDAGASDGDNPKARAAWFREGRTTVAGDEPAAAKLHRGIARKLEMRKTPAGESSLSPHAMQPASSSQLMSTQSASPAASLPSTLGVQWTPLGPAPIQPLAGQNYGPVTGRVTAIAIDSHDSTGNTLFIGAGGGGVWKSTNAADVASSVKWTPLTDNQPTLSIGALALQPGNTDCSSATPANCVILAGTGETDNSGDSYYGLGILRSTDGGQTWSLIDRSADGKLFHGLGFAGIAFSTSNPNIVVAAAAAASEAVDVGAEFAGSTRGAYYSSDGGASWNYAQFIDGTTAIAPGSVTSVVYDSVHGLFFAAYRSHGLYSSADGKTWIRLANQPGGTLLSGSNCFANTSSLSCPLYRAELAVQPQTGELFTWMVNSTAVDQGIFKSSDGGATWTQIHFFDPNAPIISGDGITNCGDAGFSNGVTGCGTDQATFNMELMAVPNGTGTDVYAGAVNVFRTSLTPQTCAAGVASCALTWTNLTHVYGCGPTGGPFQPDSHPDQHAIAAVSGAPIIFFGNDGGVYRSLNAPRLDGTCGVLLDDLNSHLGSLAQLVGFSHDANSATALQVGSQDNGTAATTDALAWNTIGGGDGGYNEISPDSTDWLNSGNYVDIAHCGAGLGCAAAGAPFSQIVSAASVGNDAAPFFMRYILDPTKPSQILVGTCRLWRGSATTAWGTTGTPISPNFFQQNIQPCASGDDMIRAIAAGGSPSGIASQVIYIGTRNGLLWVTHSPSTNISSWSGGPLPNANPVCQQGNARCAISDIALDPHDLTGATAYATVMGFGTPHLYKTTDFGTNWIDLTANLPDVPANAVLVDPNSSSTIYVGTDIGVFASTDGGQTWNEYGSSLPTVPVTQLRAFSAGSVLRASTYGRGLWQAPLAGIVPDFQLTLQITSTQQYPNSTTRVQGTIGATAGYSQAISVTCDAASGPHLQCSSPGVPAGGGTQAFMLTISNDGTIGDYTFNVVAQGADTLTHSVSFTLHVSDFALSPTTANITAPHAAPQTVAFEVNALGTYSGTLSLSCSGMPSGMTCNMQPATVTLPANGLANAMITADASVADGTYAITISAAAPDGHTKTATVDVTVTSNAIVLLSIANTNLGSAKVGQPLNATGLASSQDGFSGTATLTCSQSGSGPLGTCKVSPSAVTVTPGGAAQPIAVAITTTGAAAQNATATITAVDTLSSSLALNYSVTDFQITASGGAFLTGSVAQIPITITPLAGYVGKVNLSCDASDIPAAGCTFSPAPPYAVNGTPLNINANIALNAAAAGTYTLKINANDVDFSMLAHPAIANVAVQDFSVVPQVQSLTVNAGSATSAVISIAAQTSFSGGVSFSCSGLPAGATCLFTPNILTSVSGGATTVMTISTLKASAAPPGAVLARGSGDEHGPDPPEYRLWGSLPIFAIFSLAGGTRKRGKKWIGSIFVLLAMLSVQFACGGGAAKSTSTITTSNPTPGTPAGNYTVAIIATSGSAQRSATISLTVQ